MTFFIVLLALIIASSYFWAKGLSSIIDKINPPKDIINKYKDSEVYKSIYVKKYPTAQIKKWSSTFLLFGFILALLFSISLLLWKQPVQTDDTIYVIHTDSDPIPATVHEKVKPPKKTQKKIIKIPPPKEIIKVIKPDEPEPEPEPELEPEPKEIPKDVEVSYTKEQEGEKIKDNTPVEETGSKSEGSSSNTAPKVDNKVYSTAEEMPLFPGCENAKDKQKCHQRKLRLYLSQCPYPPMARNNDIKGKVYIYFIIDKEGQVTDVSLKRGAHKLLDNSALNHIKRMPAWTPGRRQGRPVRVQFIVPFEFDLDQ